VNRPFARRPSPAMLVALAALVLATGLPAEAAKRLNGALLKPGSVKGSALRDRTIKGNKIADDTIRGGQVAESSLGPVPRSAKADQADFATNAGFAQNAGTSAEATHAATAASAAQVALADDVKKVDGAPANNVNQGAADSSGSSCTPPAFDPVAFFNNAACGAVVFFSPAPARVLAVVTGNVNTSGGAGSADCWVQVGTSNDGSAISSANVTVGATAATTAAAPGSFALVHIFAPTDVPPAAFGTALHVRCEQNTPAVNLSFSNVRVTAFRLADTT
jgi:hypothetical protein